MHAQTNDKLRLGEAFISRAVSQHSVFSNILSRNGWRVCGCSLIRLYPLTFEVLPSADWIFFTSRHGVAYFFSGLAEAGLSVPDAKMAALGPAAADALGAYSIVPAFVGAGAPIAAAAGFLELAAGARILLPGARHRAGALPHIVSKGATVMLLDVYDNEPVEYPDPVQSEVMVFTSPMNVRAYFAHHQLLPGQRAVAIGPTTAEALLQLGIEGYRMASRPDEAGLAEAVLRIGWGS